MTVNRSIVIHVNDIKTVDLHCKCGFCFTVPIDTKKLQTAFDCPNCGVKLWQEGTALQEGLFTLVQGLQEVAASAKEQLSVTFTISDDVEATRSDFSK